MNNTQNQRDLFIFNLNSDTVEETIRKRLGTLWTHLEARPPIDHSFAVNYLARAENAARLFAVIGPETALANHERPIRRTLESFYSWHEWKWHLPPENVPLAALLTESATARGVRNRKAIVREMEIACVNAFQVEVFNLLSIGGGAAPALREMMELVTSSGHIIVLDRDIVPEVNPNWVELLPAVWQYEVRCTDPQQPARALAGKWQPHLVEAVGLGDCASDEIMSDMLAYIYGIIPVGGWLITGSLDPGATEKQYLHQMIHWPGVNYRSQQDLQQLVIRTGFDTDHLVSIQEPCGVCNIVAVAK